MALCDGFVENIGFGASCWPVVWTVAVGKLIVTPDRRPRFDHPVTTLNGFADLEGTIPEVGEEVVLEIVECPNLCGFSWSSRTVGSASIPGEDVRASIRSGHPMTVEFQDDVMKRHVGTASISFSEKA